jgi:hypothetical protein
VPGSFSARQLAALLPADPGFTAAPEARRSEYWATTAEPFEWKFTPHDLDELLVKLSTHANPQKMR